MLSAHPARQVVAATPPDAPLAKLRFGEVLEIAGADWTHEINDASRDGTWVVVLLCCRVSCGET